MSEQQVSIRAEPQTASSCRFTVDRPVYPDASFYFGDRERAQQSPLAKRLFDIEGVSSVLISHDQLTVRKATHQDWPDVARHIGAAIREHIASGDPAVDEELRASLPSEDDIRARVQQVFDNDVNPAVAMHGGVVRLIDVQDNTVFIQMGGGCQGCGMADVTLKQGIEVSIRAAVPEVGAILDTTDHAAGRNPYYTPSKK